MNVKGVRSGAPRRIRTSDTRVRSPVLYPAELWTRSGPGFTEHRLETQEESARQFNRSSSRDVLALSDEACLRHFSPVFPAIAACSDGAESEVFIAPEGCDWDDDGYLAVGERCRGDDCDDDRADISPGMTEICNFQDDDCDGSLNEELECRVYGAEEGVLIAVDPFIIDAEEFIASSHLGAGSICHGKRW